jgi:hypothetical protein
MARLTRVQLPEFGVCDAIPLLPITLYEDRLQAVVERMRRAGLTFLVVYADREHSANLSFLTGFDPRFEEALLLLDLQGHRLLLVGNECLGILPDPVLKIKTELFQEFSLVDQPRDQSRPIETIFREFGISSSAVVGCVGWKYFDGRNVENPSLAIEIPAYLVDVLRKLTGRTNAVVNATSLFINSSDGLRLTNSVDQVARFEYAASTVSNGILQVLRHLNVSEREKDLARFYDCRGLTLTCHPMLSFGEKARRALSSPSDNTAQLGQPYTLAFGVEGGLSCRAGMIAAGPQDLPAELKEIYPQLASNYFDVIATMYEGVKVGAVAGDIFDRVDAVRRKDLFTFALNPGHYLQLDEWLCSPFSKYSRVTLRSGVAIQMDLIPVPQGPFCCLNVEDGVVLADEPLRDELRIRYPATWQRIVARRQFLRDGLGIEIDDSLLPLSNMSAWLAPYAQALDLAYVKC